MKFNMWVVDINISGYFGDGVSFDLCKKGVDAHTACCVCGGGDALSVPEATQKTAWLQNDGFKWC